MKLIFPVLLFFTLISCTRQSETPPAIKEENAARADIDSAARLFLIAITNDAWYQSEMAQAALKKSHDTSILKQARIISRQYIRIKDRAKVVSIPYKLNMPYFLTGEQNQKVKELKGIPEDSFDREFIARIKGNDSVLMKRLIEMEGSPSNNTDEMKQFIDFSKSVIATNEDKMKEFQD
jgi:hypothetical protein